MTNKFKVLAMLLCVALFGTISSCTEDNGWNSVPSNDNEIYSMLIGKWSVSIRPDNDYSRRWDWDGTLEFKEDGLLIGNGRYNTNDGEDSWSFSGTGSYSLFKRHIDLSIPLEQRVQGWGTLNLFEYSGTIQSITKDNMVIIANTSEDEGAYYVVHLQCVKIE